MIRVALIGSEALRSRVQRALSAQSTISLVEETDEGLPDVLIAAGTTLEQLPATAAPIVLVSGARSERNLVGIPAFQPGVRAWLPPDVTEQELVAAIVAAAADFTILTARQAERILPMQTMRQSLGEVAEEHLTAREHEVLRLLAQGFGNKEIATELKISQHTAKFHVAQILAKMGAGSRAEAVASGIRRGLIPI